MWRRPTLFIACLLMIGSVYSQSTYPALIEVEGDTFVIITIDQMDTALAKFIELDEAKEMVFVLENRIAIHNRLIQSYDGTIQDLINLNEKTTTQFNLSQSESEAWEKAYYEERRAKRKSKFLNWVLGGLAAAAAILGLIGSIG